MIDIYDILTLLLLHLIGDYVIQTRWMARNKSSDYAVLLVHAVVYGLVFQPFGIFYAWVNAVLHGCTDGITSRATKFFWKRSQEVSNPYRKWDEWKTFLVMGLDQFVHVSCLVITFHWMFPV